MGKQNQQRLRNRRNTSNCAAQASPRYLAARAASDLSSALEFDIRGDPDNFPFVVLGNKAGDFCWKNPLLEAFWYRFGFGKNELQEKLNQFSFLEQEALLIRSCFWFLDGEADLESKRKAALSKAFAMATKTELSWNFGAFSDRAWDDSLFIGLLGSSILLWLLWLVQRIHAWAVCRSRQLEQRNGANRRIAYRAPQDETTKDFSKSGT